ncbi:MAG TPA: retropepsin-like aspartic protease [Candidatus Tumulicola sp.]|nr:retropepsin-like aspartic protease [Candidatus Tumulicola sp.]
MSAVAIARAAWADGLGSQPPGIKPTTATLSGVISANLNARGKALETFTSYVLDYSYSAGGFLGKTDTIAVGRDYLTTDTYGPFTDLAGRLNGQYWTQNENGLTVALSGLRGRADMNRLAIKALEGGATVDAARLLGETSSPVAAYVVEVHPQEGLLEWRFYGVKSGLLVRDETFDGRFRTVRTYDDFRDTKGAVLAWHYHVTDGDLTNDEDWKVSKLDVNVPVSLNDLNIRQDARALVEFPVGKESVELPMRVVDGHIITRLFINGKGYDFMLDSGAGGIFIDRGLLADLGLKRYGRINATAAGQFELVRSIVPEIHFGDLTMRNVAVYGIPFRGNVRADTKINGLVGFDFIADCVLKIDYDKQKMVAIKPDAFQMPADALGQMPITLDSSVPEVRAGIGGAYDDHFIVDTGAGDVVVFSKFSLAHPQETSDLGRGRAEAKAINGLGFGDLLFAGGVGGSFRVWPTEIEKFSFGPVNFVNWVIEKTDPNEGLDDGEHDGLIGYTFLRLFTIYFDYNRSRMILAPNGLYRSVTHTG